MSDEKELLSQLEKSKNIFELKIRLKVFAGKCSQNVFTEGGYQNDFIIPLKYDNIWICFSYNELFRELYDKNDFFVDPLFPNKLIMSEINKTIILTIDKKVNNGKLASKFLKEKKNDFSLDRKIKDKLINFKERLFSEKEKEIVLFDFIEWLNDLNIKDKELIEDIPILHEGNKVPFKEILSEYCSSSKCIKDFKNSLVFLLEFFKTNSSEEQRQIKTDLEIISED